MAMERLLEVELDEPAVYLGPSPEAQPYLLDEHDRVFIKPLEEQDFDSGSLAFEISDKNGKTLSVRGYHPYIATKKEQLKSALEDYEQAMRKGRGTIGIRKEMEIFGRIDLCLNGVVLISQDSSWLHSLTYFFFRRKTSH